MGLTLCGLVWLAGCAPLADAVGNLGPMGQALRYAVKPAVAPDVTGLPTGFAYVQVRVDGRQSVLASVPGQGDDGLWYSPQSELVHLRNGRLWRVLGMTTEWRGQQAQPPAWADVPANGEAVAWARQVNRMPGYRWAERDEVRTRRLPAPPASVAPVLATWPQAQWYETLCKATTALAGLGPLCSALRCGRGRWSTANNALRQTCA